MKRVAEFTPHQLETWAAVLGIFDPQLVNRAVIEFGCGTDPFPDVGKLFHLCLQYRTEAKQYTDGHRVQPKGYVSAVAAALGLEI